MKYVAFSVPIRMTGTDHFVITMPNGVTTDVVVVRDSADAVRFLHNDGMSFPRMQGR